MFTLREVELLKVARFACDRFALQRVARCFLVYRLGERSWWPLLMERGTDGFR